MMKFDVITIFPEAFSSYLKASALGKAQQSGLIEVNLVDLREFTDDKHKTVDDKPYGGGPGMVLMVQPIYRAVQFLRTQTKGKRTRVILFSTRGKIFNQKTAKRLSGYKHLIFICGRYEGVDERVAKHIADEEISIGEYVLSGGELPALVVIEAVSRHVKGVLGKEESLEEIKGSYPVYTRPEVFITNNEEELRVPDILLSGNHKKIKNWRKQHF